MTDARIELSTLQPPLAKEWAEALIGFWQSTFDTSFDGLRGVLGAAEDQYNRDTVYLMRRGQQPVSTCHSTISRTNPELGCLGEVATAVEFRGTGLAGSLCEIARDDFRRRNGEALFLGTVNPSAERLYRRLGWRTLEGANVMALIVDGASQEGFLADYFADDGQTATIVAGAPSERISMIPLLLSPHDWQVLDANLGLYSITHAVQSSCAGLYPRYETLAAEGRGDWFATYNATGRLVGLSSVQLTEPGCCRIDGFTHPTYRRFWEASIRQAMQWGREHDAPHCRAAITVEDEEKQACFGRLGFTQIGIGQHLPIGARNVATIVFENKPHRTPK